MESYGTVGEADTYHTALGNAAWGSAATPAKEAALVRASLWLDRKYRGRFPGTKTGGRAQEREWPRTDAVDTNGDDLPDDEVPTEIEQVVYEASLRELASPGSLSPDNSGGTIKSERKKLGPLEKEIVYVDGKQASAVSIEAIDNLLTNILLPASGGTTVTSLFRA